MNILKWLPRMLMIVYILFISLFALDSFDGDSSLGEKLLGFLIHLIPTFILIILYFLGLKYEKIVGAIAIILGLVYIFTALGRFDFLTYVLISGPLFLVGILYIIYGIKKGKQ